MPKIQEKIYPEAIDTSIKETEKNLKQQMINFQKIVKQVSQLDDNILKQKIEKKEMVRMIKNEIIQLEDLPYEKAIREEEKKKILEKDSIKNVKKTEDSSLDTKIIHKKSNLMKNHLMSKTFKRRHNVNIGEELSFLIYLSLSKLDDSNQNNNE